MEPAREGELTDAERRIVELVCEGLSNAQIAARLHSAPETVRWHLKNVFRKLDVGSRTELAVRVLRATEVPGSSRDPEQNPP